MMFISLPPWQGITIPTVIIASLGYLGHYFVYQYDLTRHEQYWFQFCLTMIWISYVIAIYKDPGSLPRDFQPREGQWRRWCKRCKCYKPERAHHCKTCNRCVLKMDHHCPWTANCVGYKNMPHFLRFLFWVDYTNGLACYYLCRRLVRYWNDRDLPIYLISKTTLTFTIILTPLSIFVVISVGLLTFRCLYGIIFTGMTQIEGWEWERVESQHNTLRFFEKIQANYKSFFGKPLPSAVSWSSSHRMIRDDNQPLIALDDIVFPYDINPWRNIYNAIGYPWNWIVPWGGPEGDGLSFEKNELLDMDTDDVSSLPWPPDGNHQDLVDQTGEYDVDSNEISVKRRLVEPRTEWRNEYGEKLSDFGVDIDAEQ